MSTVFYVPSVYAYIHKMHHKYITSMAFTVEYAHAAEHILTNVLPITLPLYLKGTRFSSIMFFVIFELWEAAADHSDYDFLKLPPAELHDLHHEKFLVNHGLLGRWARFTVLTLWVGIGLKRRSNTRLRLKEKERGSA
ncbi:hypothetical protein BDW68DRAFT_178424 [Aspergillus falconensis]